MIFLSVYSDGIDSQPPISPMRILRESPVPTDSKWLDEHINDFSLSSFLGHLESNCDASNSRRSRSPRCVSIHLTVFRIFQSRILNSNVKSNQFAAGEQ